MGWNRMGWDYMVGWDGIIWWDGMGWKGGGGVGGERRGWERKGRCGKGRGEMGALHLPTRPHACLRSGKPLYFRRCFFVVFCLSLLFRIGVDFCFFSPLVLCGVSFSSSFCLFACVFACARDRSMPQKVRQRKNRKYMQRLSRFAR